MVAGHHISPQVAAGAHKLVADVTTARLLAALRQAGVRAIMLKGPAVAEWLYQGAVRLYGDCDILISEEDLDAAEAVLEDLEFCNVGGKPIPNDRPWYARCWTRTRDGAVIDVHRTLSGIGVAPTDAWRVLSLNTEPMWIKGVDVEVLREPARALHVALHAAHHGTRSPKPLEDLTRALDLVKVDAWRTAASLAVALEARAAFAAGLNLLPEGRRLALTLGVFDKPSVEIALRVGSAPRLSLGIAWLMGIPGLRPKLRLVFRKAVPSPDYLRGWKPLAQRGPAGLCLAYLWRPLWLLWHALAGLRAWRQASRACCYRLEPERPSLKIGISPPS
jgi:hypothetical protein